MPEPATGAATRDGQNVTIVHDRLRQEILGGSIPPGETSQAALARDLDVGRSRLREAIRMLQREGLVLAEPNRRLRIAALVFEGLGGDYDPERLRVACAALAPGSEDALDGVARAGA